nr:e3 ubiquitin-protein ligase pib1 [Quercus suber]
MSSPPHRHPPISSHRNPPARQRSDSSVQGHRWPDSPPSAAAADSLRPGFGLLGLHPDFAERKRRHTGLEHDRRSYPYPVFGESSVRGARQSDRSTPPTDTGTSRETAIDLVTPPRSSVMSQQSGQGDGGSTEPRRESDTAVPIWQPDDVVSSCPVCKTRFNIWYRKHHCRKCGRVVCAACSPHRITIPRQYIVQQSNSEGVTPSRDDDQTSPASRNPALGGGEIVRVCNPCVPDPWTPDTLIASNNADFRETANVPALTNSQRELADEAQNSRQRSERFHGVLPLAQSPVRSGRAGSWSQHASPSIRDSPPVGPFYGPMPPIPPPFREVSIDSPPSHLPHPRSALHYGRGPYLGMLSPQVPSSSRPPAHRYSRSSSGATMDQSRLGNQHRLRNPNWRPTPPTLPGESSRPLPSSAAKHVVKEEDECPVCGIELPPNEQFRENHVQNCISARFSTGATPPSSIAMIATGSSDATSTNTYPAVRSGTPTSSSPVPHGRPRATSYRPRGMAVYTATEKDCTNAEGEAQECVICFEEFQPGHELGRMECLCKFHRTCIRSWWDRKGGGSCPTHQLQE